MAYQDGHLRSGNNKTETMHSSELSVYEQLLMLCPLETGMQLVQCCGQILPMSNR